MTSVDAVADRRLHDGPEAQQDYQHDLEVWRRIMHQSATETMFWIALGEIIRIKQEMKNGKER